MWFKNEGIFYFLIFGTLLIFLSNNSITPKFLLFILVISIIYLQRYLQGNIIGINEINPYYINDQILVHLLNFKPLLFQAVAVTKHIIIATLKYSLWVLIFFSLFFSNIFKNRNKTPDKYFFFAIVLNFLFIYSIYLYAPITNEHILSVTMDRIMFQTSGFYIPILIFILNNILSVLKQDLFHLTKETKLFSRLCKFSSPVSPIASWCNSIFIPLVRFFSFLHYFN